MTRFDLLIAVMASTLLLPLVVSAQTMPVRGSDLDPNERFHTFDHSPGMQGIQLEGYDIGVRRRFSNSAWVKSTKELVDAKVLTNWASYGKPVYAMAPGTVIGCWRNAPENTPGSLHPDYVSRRFAGGGNHLWIQQADGVVALYAHMQPGSIPPSICPNHAILFTGTSAAFAGNPDIDPSVRVAGGATIAEGQQIGLLGNSGQSADGPHLHVHMERNNAAFPINFARGLTVLFATGTASLDGPWTSVAGGRLPRGPILIWPPRPIGNYTFTKTLAADYGRLFHHMNDSGMMPALIWCESGGLIYNANWVPAQGQWVSHHNLTAVDALTKHLTYTKQGFNRTSSSTCGPVTVAVWRK